MAVQEAAIQLTYGTATVQKRSQAITLRLTQDSATLTAKGPNV